MCASHHRSSPHALLLACVAVQALRTSGGSAATHPEVCPLRQEQADTTLSHLGLSKTCEASSSTPPAVLAPWGARHDHNSLPPASRSDRPSVSPRRSGDWTTSRTAAASRACSYACPSQTPAEARRPAREGGMEVAGRSRVGHRPRGSLPGWSLGPAHEGPRTPA